MGLHGPAPWGPAARSPAPRRRAAHDRAPARGASTRGAAWGGGGGGGGDRGRGRGERSVAVKRWRQSQSQRFSWAAGRSRDSSSRSWDNFQDENTCEGPGLGPHRLQRRDPAAAARRAELSDPLRGELAERGAALRVALARERERGLRCPLSELQLHEARQHRPQRAAALLGPQPRLGVRARRADLPATHSTLEYPFVWRKGY